ncbi:MAG TPA: beta-N-acetylhexosaminidase [Caulobacteraceae bacterium]
MTSACIFGCAGQTLSADERDFFRDAKPWGFIVFRRNIETPEQLRALVDGLRETVGRADAPVLIDQEGGRVQRMGPPHWPKYPPARLYGKAGSDPLTRREIARLGARLIAHDLHAVGINVDCVPMLDVPQPGAHEIVGDRAYGTDADSIALLGRAQAEGLIAGGVLPVIKHMPGHGRAGADSHEALPVVDASYAELEAVDFAPFRALSDMPMGMSAHVVYTSVDAKHPGTTSRKVIHKVIRKEIGFSGLLMTDDLSMKALSGDFGARTRDALKAGCDVVLHCNGVMDEMQAVARAVPKLAGRSKRRAEAVTGRLAKTPEPFDVEEGRRRFAQAFEAAA